MEWGFPTVLVFVLLLLCAVLALDGYFRRLYLCAPRETDAAYPCRILLRVEGLTGKGSARRAEEALNAVAGVRAYVDLCTGRAFVGTKAPVAPQVFLDALARAGFGAHEEENAR